MQADAEFNEEGENRGKGGETRKRKKGPRLNPENRIFRKRGNEKRTREAGSRNSRIKGGGQRGVFGEVFDSNPKIPTGRSIRRKGDAENCGSESKSKVVATGAY